jgi:hypothetical protein
MGSETEWNDSNIIGLVGKNEVRFHKIHFQEGLSCYFQVCLITSRHSYSFHQIILLQIFSYINTNALLHPTASVV